MSERGQFADRSEPLRLAILQRVVTPYRVALFRRLSAEPNLDLRVFAGDDLPNSKVRNAADVSGIDVVRVPTKFIQIGGRTIVHHQGLLSFLADFAPDAILTEGESNLLSALGALRYRLSNPHVAALHWSLGGLPGEPMQRTGLRARLVNLFRKRFDAFVVYSSYGKDVLRVNGVNPGQVFVATNVADLTKHVKASKEISRESARAELSLDERCLVLFVGALTKAKRLKVLVEAAESLDPNRFHVVIVGDGEMLDWLASEVERRGLTHVSLPGRISGGIASYFAAADVVALPGRGGMVISEAMAYGCPVIAYHADGTEFDLVIDGETGIRMKRGDSDELREALERVALDSDRFVAMGNAARDRLLGRFGIEDMSSQIMRAVLDALGRRNG